MDPVLFLEIDNRLLQRFGHTAREVYDHLHSFGYTPFRTGKNLTLSPAPYGWEDELVIFMKKRATTA